MQKFLTDFLNLINVWADESIAVGRLKDDYRSPLIINFCNMAGQALSGRGNEDYLTSFSIELAAKRKSDFKEKAEKRAEKLNILSGVVMLILFEFVILSIMSKVNVDLSGVFKIFTS